jgi:hypothetical protein
MYNPWMMNQMYNPPPQQGGGAQREGMGWRADRREGMEQRGGIENKIGRTQDRLWALKEQFKGASSSDQAGIQGRMDKLQGRINNWQGQLDAGQGANRLGMGWRKERRQAKNAGLYNPDAGYGGDPMPELTGAQRPGMEYRKERRQARRQGAGDLYGGGPGSGPNPIGGMPPVTPYSPPPVTPYSPPPITPYGPAMQPQQGGGQQGAAPPGMTWHNGVMIPNLSGAPGSQYTDQFGNIISRDQYAEQLRGGPQAAYNNLLNPSAFQTQFGTLVPMSGGNSNVFKRNGSDESMLYHYDPNQGWKTMSRDAYRGYGDYNYFNPRSSVETARKAGAMPANNLW